MHFSEITKLQFGKKRHTLLCILQAIKATTFSVVGKTQQLNNAKNPSPSWLPLDQSLLTSEQKIAKDFAKDRLWFRQGPSL